MGYLNFKIVKENLLTIEDVFKVLILKNTGNVVLQVILVAFSLM